MRRSSILIILVVVTACIGVFCAIYFIPSSLEYAYILEKEGHIEEAKKVYESLADKDKSEASHAIKPLVHVLLQQANIDEAILHLKEYLSKFGENEELQTLLGKLYENNNMPYHHLLILNEIYKVNPTEKNLRQRKLIYESFNQIPPQIEILKELIANEQAKQSDFIELINLYATKSEMQKAEKKLWQMLRIWKPDELTAESASEVIAFLFYTKQKKLAFEIAYEYVEAHPKEKSPAGLWVDQFVAHGMSDQALKLLKLLSPEVAREPEMEKHYFWLLLSEGKGHKLFKKFQSLLYQDRLSHSLYPMALSLFLDYGSEQSVLEMAKKVSFGGLSDDEIYSIVLYAIEKQDKELLDLVLKKTEPLKERSHFIQLVFEIGTVESENQLSHLRISNLSLNERIELAGLAWQRHFVETTKDLLHTIGSFDDVSDNNLYRLPFLYQGVGMMEKGLHLMLTRDRKPQTPEGKMAFVLFLSYTNDLARVKYEMPQNTSDIFFNDLAYLSDEEGSYTVAIWAAQELLKRDPNKIESELLYLNILVDAGKKQEVKNHLELLLAEKKIEPSKYVLFFDIALDTESKKLIWEFSNLIDLNRLNERHQYSLLVYALKNKDEELVDYILSRIHPKTDLMRSAIEIARASDEEDVDWIFRKSWKPEEAVLLARVALDQNFKTGAKELLSSVNSFDDIPDSILYSLPNLYARLGMAKQGLEIMQRRKGAMTSQAEMTLSLFLVVTGDSKRVFQEVGEPLPSYFLQDLFYIAEELKEYRIGLIAAKKLEERYPTRRNLEILARAYLDADDTKEAYHLAHKLMKLESEDFNLFWDILSASLIQNITYPCCIVEDVLQLWARVPETDLKNRTRAGRVMQGTGYYDLTLDLLYDVLDKDPLYKEAFHSVWETYIFQSRYTTAARWILDYLQYYPDDYLAYYYYGVVVEILCCSEIATPWFAASLRELYRLPKLDAGDISIEAQLLYRLSFFSAMFERYEYLFGNEPFVLDHRVNFLNTLIDIREYDLSYALIHYRPWLVSSNEWRTLRGFEETEIRYLTEQASRCALPKADLFTQQYPEDPTVWNAKSSTLHKAGDWVGAYKTAQYAVSLDPENQDSGKNLFDIYKEHLNFLSAEYYRKITGKFQKEHILKVPFHTYPTTNIFLSALFANDVFRVKDFTDYKTNVTSTHQGTDNALFAHLDLNLWPFPLTLQTKFYASENTCGGGAGLEWRVPFGLWRLGGDYHKPYWEFSETLVYKGNEDQVYIYFEHKFPYSVEFNIKLSEQRYNFEQLFNVASSRTVEGGISYTPSLYRFLGRFWALSFNYELYGQYKSGAKQYVQSDGTITYPLLIASEEVHSLFFELTRPFKCYGEIDGTFGVAYDRMSQSHLKLIGTASLKWNKRPGRYWEVFYRHYPSVQAFSGAVNEIGAKVGINF